MKETSMANALQDKIDARASLWEQMKALDLGKAEDAEQYDKIEADYDKVDGEIEREERHMARVAHNAEVDRRGAGDSASDIAEGDEQLGAGYTEAFDRWMRGGVPALDSEQVKVLHNGWQDAPKAAAGVGTGSAGGYTVPPAFRQKIIERITFVASMRQLAEVITTETGANLPWPTVDDTGNEGAILGENTAAAEQDVTFGQNSLDAYMYTSKIVRASLQLLQDNAFDFEGWLAKALGARIGRIQNRHFTVGTGSSQPDGLFTSAVVGATAAGAAAIVYDDLVELTESLDPAYLEGGNLRFIMSQTARKLIRKLKDSQNRPLWEPSLQAGAPNTLMGYDVTLNNYVAVPATGVKSVGFGNVEEAYVIRDTSDFALMRLTERYAEFLQVGFLGFQRSDGTLQNPAAFKVLQQA